MSVPTSPPPAHVGPSMMDILQFLCSFCQNLKIENYLDCLFS